MLTRLGGWQMIQSHFWLLTTLHPYFNDLGICSRILFLVFSLTLSSIIPDILHQIPIHLTVLVSAFPWIISYPTVSPAAGETGDHLLLHKNPHHQGCMLFLLLFYLHTNDCSLVDRSVKLLKSEEDFKAFVLPHSAFFFSYLYLKKIEYIHILYMYTLILLFFILLRLKFIFTVYLDTLSD